VWQVKELQTANRVSVARTGVVGLDCDPEGKDVQMSEKREGAPTPGILQKSLDLFDRKGVEFFQRSKESVSDRRGKFYESSKLESGVPRRSDRMTGGRVEASGAGSASAVAAAMRESRGMLTGK
jgi:hypothetical protein